MRINQKRQYFYFTKKEKTGIVVLLIINLFLIYLPVLLEKGFPEKPYDQNGIIASFSNLHQISGKQNSNLIQEENFVPDLLKLVNFDPNTITMETWKQMGLSESIMHTIEKYRQRGGMFHDPDDIKKIWGISSSLALKLIPYVVIKDTSKKNERPYFSFNNRVKEQKKQIDINLADTSAFESLFGIGPTLSRRIVLYRKKLGGYYSIDQISEVWGLQDSVFQKIKSRLVFHENLEEKIDINTAKLEQLKSHPYIGFAIAQAIINFRNQHGPFKSLEDIQKIVIIDKEKYEKLAHYLVIKE